MHVSAVIYAGIYFQYSILYDLLFQFHFKQPDTPYSQLQMAAIVVFFGFPTNKPLLPRS